MSRLKHYLLVGIGIVAVFATSALMNTRPAAAQNKDASKDAFEVSLVLTGTAAGLQATNNFIVPAGKRLVIEHVSGGISVGPGEKAGLDMHTVLDNVTRIHFFVTSPQGTFPGGGTHDVYRVSQPARLYADGGTPVTFIIFRDSASSGFVMFGIVTVSGTLTNL